MTFDPRPPGMPIFMDPEPIIDPANRPSQPARPMDAQTAEDLFGGNSYIENGSARGPRQVPAVPGVNMNTPRPQAPPLDVVDDGPCPECARKQQAYLFVGVGLGAVMAGALLYLVSRRVARPAPTQASE